MIFDPKRKKELHTTLHQTAVERVKNYKFLDRHIREGLNLVSHHTRNGQKKKKKITATVVLKQEAKEIQQANPGPQLHLLV